MIGTIFQAIVAGGVLLALVGYACMIVKRHGQ